MRSRDFAAFVLTFLVLSVGACGTDVDDRREAAIGHAFANPDLRRSAAEFAALGWIVSDRAEASVEWLDPAMNPQLRSTATPTTWTRVRIPMVRPTYAGQPSVAADLVVASSEDGVDEFALVPRSEAAEAELKLAIEAIDGPEAQDVQALAAPAPPAAACGAENAACGGVTTCCWGLVCTNIRDNHSICFCSQPVTARYNERSTTSVACFSLPDNPIGAARMVRTIQGCGPSGGLAADACGKIISTPKYIRSSTVRLVCYPTPPRGCVSE